MRSGHDLPTPADVFAQCDQHGLIARETLAQILLDRGVKETHQEAWLSEHPRSFRTIGDHIARWDGDIADKCVALLAAFGEPADTKDLVNAVGEGHNPRGARNQILSDPRVMRVGRRLVGLRTWGGEEYSSIAEEIAEAIDDAGGTIALTDLVAKLQSTFSLRPSSIRAYISAPLFVLSHSSVRRRRTDEPFPFSLDLTKVRGAFQPEPGVLVLSVLVDQDVLRGSGRQLPSNAGAVLGLTPGRSLTFSSPHGDVVATWSMTSISGPSLGSTRVLARGVRAVVGERLTLRFDREAATVEPSVLPPSWPTSTQPDAALRRLTGIPVGPDLRNRLAAAIDTTPDRLHSALVARGDSQIADLIDRVALPPSRARSQ